MRIEQGKHYKILKREQDNLNIPNHVDNCSRDTREHTDVAVRLEERTVFLEKNLITKERVKKSLIKLKTKKARGPDGIKPEFYKVFLNNDILLKTLVETFMKLVQRKYRRAGKKAQQSCQKTKRE